MQVGNHLFGNAEKVDLRKYDIAADKDDSIPTPEPPEGQTVAGKPREFLKYAPMWAAHPDHDRVRPQRGAAREPLQGAAIAYVPGWRGCRRPVHLGRTACVSAGGRMCSAFCCKSLKCTAWQLQ